MSKPKSDEDAGPTSVGYCQPPEATRFKPGVSGNPNGRPKGGRNIGTALRQIYMSRVTIREGTRVRQISRWEAALLKQLEQALKGDPRAMQGVIDNVKRFGLVEHFIWPTNFNAKALTTNELHDLKRLLIKARTSEE